MNKSSRTVQICNFTGLKFEVDNVHMSEENREKTEMLPEKLGLPLRPIFLHFVWKVHRPLYLCILFLGKEFCTIRCC
jgi:hypothetical protein